MQKDDTAVQDIMKQISSLNDEVEKSVDRICQTQKSYPCGLMPLVGVACLLLAVYLKVQGICIFSSTLRASEFVVLILAAVALFIFPYVLQRHMFNCLMAIVKERQRLGADMIRQKRRSQEKDKEWKRETEQKDKEWKRDAERQKNIGKKTE